VRRGGDKGRGQIQFAQPALNGGQQPGGFKLALEMDKNQVR
jgi:hypothetical protein